MNDLIKRKEVINYARKCADGYSYIELPIDAFVDGINALPPAETESDDLIIKGAKGIKDGLYNIKEGKLYQYKANGGTVRTYKISSAEQVTSKLKKPCDSLLTDDSDCDKECKSKLDLISRADAIEAVRKCKVQDIRFGNVTSNMMLVQQGEVIVALLSLPSADAVQGEWEHWGSPFSDESEVIYTIVCSVCGARFVEPKDESKGEYNYCPNCGARMKEEK